MALSRADGFEWQMLDLINAERAARGLPPVQLEQRLNHAAEGHSAWMIAADTFGHTGVGGTSPTERIREAGFALDGYWSTAENIAWQSERGAPGLSDDVVDLHRLLMESPSHRANVLDPAAEYVGIGIVRGEFAGFDGVFVTQNFASTDGPVALDARPMLQPDALIGARGDDVLRGSGAADRIDGRGGDDRLVGRGGDDVLLGRGGDDRLVGGAGNDTLKGGGGRDDQRGGRGHDDLAGGRGADALRGGAGRDDLRGGGGRDDLHGGRGRDDLRGGGGRDELNGGGGRDHLHGGGGRDVLKGGGGDDTLYGARGRDVLVGGGGDDAFVFRKGMNVEVVRDYGRGADVIDVRGFDAARVEGAARRRGDDVVIEIGPDRMILRDVEVDDLVFA